MSNSYQNNVYHSHIRQGINVMSNSLKHTAHNLKDGRE